MSDVKQKAIGHYERMIKWAEKQDSDEQVFIFRMDYFISEYWYGGQCSYCRHYYVYGCCGDCPLSNEDTKQSVDCCDGLWHRMDNSKTWGEWVINAKRVLEYIKENG